MNFYERHYNTINFFEKYDNGRKGITTITKELHDELCIFFGLSEHLKDIDKQINNILNQGYQKTNLKFNYTVIDVNENPAGFYCKIETPFSEKIIGFDWSYEKDSSSDYIRSTDIVIPENAEMKFISESYSNQKNREGELLKHKFYKLYKGRIHTLQKEREKREVLHQKEMDKYREEERLRKEQEAIEKEKKRKRDKRNAFIDRYWLLVIMCIIFLLLWLQKTFSL